MVKPRAPVDRPERTGTTRACVSVVHIRTRQLYLSQVQQTHPTDHRGGFPRSGITVGVSHASWALWNGLMYIWFPLSPAWADQPYNQYEHTHPSTTPLNTLGIPSHSLSLSHTAPKLTLHLGRNDRNLLFLHASPFTRCQVCVKHKKRLNFTR